MASLDSPTRVAYTATLLSVVVFITSCLLNPPNVNLESYFHRLLPSAVFAETTNDELPPYNAPVADATPRQAVKPVVGKRTEPGAVRTSTPKGVPPPSAQATGATTKASTIRGTARPPPTVVKPPVVVSDTITGRRQGNSQSNPSHTAARGASQPNSPTLVSPASKVSSNYFRYGAVAAIVLMAADSSTIWLIAFGVVILVIGLCLFYSLRQVTVLRESVDELAINMTKSKVDLERAVEDVSVKILPAQQAAAAAASPNAHAQAAETAELLIKVRALEKELAGQQQRLTEFIHRAATERHASPRRDGNGNDADATDASFVSMVSPQSPMGNGRGSVETSPALAFEESTTLQAARMLASSSSRTSRPSRPTNRGLSFSLPPKMWVYERVSSDPRDCVMKKRLHSIMLGHTADVNTPGEVCFLFAAIDTSRQQGVAEVLAEAARNRSGAPGVTCIPMNAILAMDIRPAPRELVDAMGPVAGDGHNLLVSIYRTTGGTALAGPHGSAGGGAAAARTASWSAGGELDVNRERSGAIGNQETLSRKAFLSRTAGGGAGTSVSDKPFVIFIPSSLALDEWIGFVTHMLGDRVKVAEGAASEAHYLDL
jgi:hypothetical protein